MIWTIIDKRKPIATQSGDWCGLKSDPLLVADKDGKHHIAVMYEGILDGKEFCNFYDENDYEIENVTHWMEIPSVTNQC